MNPEIKESSVVYKRKAITSFNFLVGNGEGKTTKKCVCVWVGGGGFPCGRKQLN